MARRDQYRIGQPTITKATGAHFIADHLFPARERPAIYKRFHSRINEAQKKGNLPPDPMKVGLFFGWAVEQNECLRLRDILGISIPASVYVTGSTGFAAVGKDVSAVASPTNDDELKLRYPEEVQKREAAERENLELKKKLADIQLQKEARKLEFSSNGKQGGRGKEK